jgi:NAD(P)-dependent dehydrogenase (short-subunit alcohol dehydrogenase family)
MENLKGKTAFITGGASGLGLGMAKAFANDGMNVILVDFRQKAIDEALTYFAEKGLPAKGLQLDVTDRAAYEKAAVEAEAMFGKIHVLVNNAGIGIPEGPLYTDKWEDIDLAVDVNYKGVLNGVKIILPLIMKHGEGGHVVSTASKAALVPVPGFTLYNSLKMAVCTAMETLACDMKQHNIGASTFFPGPFMTNLGASSGEVRAKHLGIEVPQMPPMRPAPAKDGEAAPPPPPMPAFDMSKIMRDPLEAGERVLRGIKRNDLYIMSHVDFKEGWVARAEAIEKCFPDEKPTEGFKQIFSMLAYNPIFEPQTQVPPLTGYEK